MRLGEVLALEWRDVQVKPANGAKFGYFHVRTGKSRNARQNLCITSRVREVLENCLEQTTGKWVFCRADGKKPISVFTLEGQYSGSARSGKLDPDFVIHSLRRTMWRRLGEARADAFTIMKIAGHNSVTVSQRSVHPSPEAVERAFERLARFSALKIGLVCNMNYVTGRIFMPRGVPGGEAKCVRGPSEQGARRSVPSS